MAVLCAGILVADLFLPPLQRLPAEGELLDTEDFLVQPGGCAANTAIALTRLGVPAIVAGCVGEDLFGDLVESELSGRGIGTAGVRRASGFGTSKTVILPVVGEDRRFVHTFGANAAFRATDIADEAIAGASVLYVGGYLVLPALRQSELARRLRFAREWGLRTVLDVAVPTGRSQLSVEDVAELLPHTDVFVPNDDEARLLTGEADPHRCAARFLELGAETVVITLGERGSLVRTGSEALEVPAPSVPVVEPSGAGDAFDAGMILGLLENWELERCVRFASVVGASACTALGCWAGIWTRDQAEGFLAEHPLEARAVARA